MALWLAMVAQVVQVVLEVELLESLVWKASVAMAVMQAMVVWAAMVILEKIHLVLEMVQQGVMVAMLVYLD